MKPCQRKRRTKLPQGTCLSPRDNDDTIRHCCAAYSLFFLCDRHLAEDESQEVFIRAYRNWSGYRGESSVKTGSVGLDLNTREIAEATESPEGTVRGRLHRGRELLGEYLTKEEGVDK